MRGRSRCVLPRGQCWHPALVLDKLIGSGTRASSRSARLNRLCPRQDSNLRACLRRAPLYPLSYGGQECADLISGRSVARNPPEASGVGRIRRGAAPTCADRLAAHDARPARRRGPSRRGVARSPTATSPSSPRSSRSRSRSSARATPSTATTPPTSRSSSPSRPASRPRAVAELVAARLRDVARRGHASTSPDPGSSTSPSTPPPSARSRAPSSSRASTTAGSTATPDERQRRVHLGQPDRSAPPRAHPLGRRRRRDRPRPRGRRRRRRHASSTSTTAASRWTSSASPSRRAPSAPRSPRAATRAPTSTTLAQQIVAADPGIVDLPARRAAGRVPRGRLRPAAPAAEGHPRRASTPTSTSGTPSARCTPAARSSAAFEKLREQGHMFEADGAVWLRTTDFDDDKDRVLVKADGELTYFARDTAYYVDKRDRGFDVCIYLLGADHHGYVNRLRAVAACAGDDPDHNIEVLIGQLVKMVQGRRGGPALQARRQHHHARGPRRGGRRRRRSLLAHPLPRRQPADARPRPARLAQQRQPGLLRAVRARPDRLGAAQRRRSRHRLARSRLRPLAARPRAGERRCSALIGELPRDRRHAPPSCASRTASRATSRSWPTATTSSTTCAGCCPGADAELEPINVARLWLCAAARQTLANGLAMLGVSAPDRM